MSRSLPRTSLRAGRGHHCFQRQLRLQTSTLVRLPIVGAAPKRLTWHSADDLVEGSTTAVVFSARKVTCTPRARGTFASTRRLHRSVADSRLRLMSLDISADGRTIAYSQTTKRHTPHHNGSRIGRHRVASAIMSFRTRSEAVPPCPPSLCNDVNPMWIGVKVSRLRPQRRIHLPFRFDPASVEVRQVMRTRLPIVNAMWRQGRVISSRGHLPCVRSGTSNTTTFYVPSRSDLRETLRFRSANGTTCAIPRPPDLARLL